MFRSCLVLIALTLGFSAAGQGSFHYVAHHGESLFRDIPTYLDLNEDEMADFELQFRSAASGVGTGSFWLELHLLNESRVVANSYYFGDVSILESGTTVIGDSITVRLDREPPGDGSHRYNWVGTEVLSGFSLGSSSSGHSTGLFALPDSLIGFQIREEDGYHNGWIRFEPTGVDSWSGIRVADWAYNLTPGIPFLPGSSRCQNHPHGC
jgi:hypothetical protein